MTSSFLARLLFMDEVIISWLSHNFFDDFIISWWRHHFLVKSSFVVTWRHHFLDEVTIFWWSDYFLVKSSRWIFLCKWGRLSDSFVFVLCIICCIFSNVDIRRLIRSWWRVSVSWRTSMIVTVANSSTNFVPLILLAFLFSVRSSLSFSLYGNCHSPINYFSDMFIGRVYHFYMLFV